MNGKLVSLSMMADNNIAESSAYYEKLTGQNFATTMHEAVGYGAWASAGVKLVIMECQDEWSGVMASFRVDNLKEALKLSKESGCTILNEGMPMSLPKALEQDYEDLTHEIGLIPRDQIAPTLGVAAIVSDPSGNVVSLVELHPHAETHYEEGDLSNYAVRYQKNIVPRVNKMVAGAGIK